MDEPDPIDFKEHESMVEAQALPAFMSLVLLFGAACQGATSQQRLELSAIPEMLNQHLPLAKIGQAILDVRGPNWTIPEDTMRAIERLHSGEEST